MATAECNNGNGYFGGFCGGGGAQCMTEMVDQGTIESHRYYFSRRTVLEMLRDRGYDVAHSELSRSLTEFRATFGNNPDLESLRICTPLRSNPYEKMLAIFMGKEEIRTPAIRSLYGQIVNKDGLHGLILVLQSKMNHFARKELDKFPFKVEIFQITDLLVNITKHVLQPKLDILTAEQKQQLFQKYKVEEKQLPRMLENDAIARYYGLEKGQVVKVTYSDGLVGCLVTYRCVM